MCVFTFQEKQLHARARLKQSWHLVPLKLSSLLPALLHTKQPGIQETSFRNLDFLRKGPTPTPRSTLTTRPCFKQSMVIMPQPSEPGIWMCLDIRIFSSHDWREEKSIVMVHVAGWSPKPVGWPGQNPGTKSLWGERTRQPGWLATPTCHSTQSAFHQLSKILSSSIPSCGLTIHLFCFRSCLFQWSQLVHTFNQFQNPSPGRSENHKNSGGQSGNQQMF